MAFGRGLQMNITFNVVSIFSNNNSLYLNTVKTDGSCTADVAVYYNTKQYSTIQYNT